PDFAQKGMDFNSWLNLRSYLRMQIANFFCLARFWLVKVGFSVACCTRKEKKEKPCTKKGFLVYLFC
ncbi:hypothetical protein ACTZTQ_13050, partial [Klebsiella pneumoniae]